MSGRAGPVLGIDLADLTGVPERVRCETCTASIDLAAQADAAVGCAAGGFHCLACVGGCGDCAAAAVARSCPLPPCERPALAGPGHRPDRGLRSTANHRRSQDQP